MNKEPITHPNGILNLKYLQEEAKTMNLERARAILKKK